MRCSQPLYGAQGKRSKEDEKFLNLILQQHQKKGFVFDTRTNSTISAHKSKGEHLFVTSRGAQRCLGVTRFFRRH